MSRGSSFDWSLFSSPSPLSCRGPDGSACFVSGPGPDGDPVSPVPGWSREPGSDATLAGSSPAPRTVLSVVGSQGGLSGPEEPFLRRSDDGTCGVAGGGPGQFSGPDPDLSSVSEGWLGLSSPWSRNVNKLKVNQALHRAVLSHQHLGYVTLFGFVFGPSTK